jgi:hypothetical protein
MIHDETRDQELAAGLPPDETNVLKRRPLPPLIPEPREGDPWVASAVKAVEASITKFADEFRVHPFAHRVEHSLHVRLVRLLSERDELRGWYPLREGGFKSQLIHKEWPETYGEKLEDGTSKRRGSFDIAIVTPGQLRQASIDQFRLGRIAAPIVIELGLGYWDKHLCADHKKLEDSKVQHGYLVHLSRMPSARRMRTEKLINGMQNKLINGRQNVQVVYVHHDIPNKRVSYKALDGKLVTEEDYSPE